LPKRSLEQIIRLLKDEQWHDIDEIANRTQLSPLKMQLITEFLAKYGFIQLNRKNARIKISRYMAEFFHRISTFDAEKKG
jgi:predicted transcriptional regulator